MSKIVLRAKRPVAASSILNSHADAVKVTLGPKGHNVVLESGAPHDHQRWCVHRQEIELETLQEDRR